jgi:nucleotide-binding universal stress UspA family protein
MFHSILCPIDFSGDSERALAYAMDLAKLTGARLTLLTVVDELLNAATQAAGNPDTLTAQTQQELGELLARMSAGGRAAGRLDIAVVVGQPAREILKRADENGSDLIVMGTQGTGGARRLVFGSTTARVLRESRVPVLAVPVPRPGFRGS